MTFPPRRLAAIAFLAIAVIVTACRAQTGASPSEPQPSPTPSASSAASAEPEPSASPTDQPTPAQTPRPSGDATAPFPVNPNAAADALFLDRDTCTNAEDGYRVAFPDAWWTNTAIGDVTPCNWFAPTTFDVPDPSQVPAEIAITITWMEGDFGSFDEVLSHEWGLVGGTQPAVRIEYERSDGGRSYVYQVQLGPTPEEGPNLVAMTSADMAGDYELNKAVLDRIMATMELLGSID